MSLIRIRHPDYTSNFENWVLWRNAYEGGDAFIEMYLKKFSRRENDSDFAERKSMTYNPAFAKSAIQKVKNAIFQRTADVTRAGGPTSYQRAIKGFDGGVDMSGATMGGYLGRYILDELLPMRKVGLYLDMPRDVGITLRDKGSIHPYIYKYCVEDICSWSHTYGNNNEFEFSSLLLHDHCLDVDQKTGLIKGEVTRYRFLWLDADHNVWFKFIEEDEAESEPQMLGIKKIPFVLLDIGASLMADIAKYQVALLNMASSDVNFCVKGNFPIYTEQFSPQMDMLNKARADSSATDTDRSLATNEITTGVSAGRRYPIGTDQPGFINPSAEPLIGSMDKQERMKQEILFLVNLALSSIQPSAMASAESKNIDERSLENGLAAIGLELEHAEKQLGKFWAMYEGDDQEPTVLYPEDYSLKNDQERREEAKHLGEVVTKVPSKTFQKEVAKKIAELEVGKDVAEAVIKEIRDEIDAAHNIDTSFDAIASDIDKGILDKELAAEIRGYPKGTVEKAKSEQVETLKLMTEAQSPKDADGNAITPARGVPFGGGDPDGSKKEKEGKKRRGEGKKQ